MDHRKVVARYLDREMNRLGLSQSELARRIDVRPSVVNRWVNGERLPLPESIEALAEALNANPDRLLVMAGYRRNREELPETDPRHHLWTKLVNLEWTPERELVLSQMLDSMLAIDAGKGAAPHPDGAVYAFN